MTVRTHAGGCLCGALRFEAKGEPLDAGYCHCRMCQRSSGAPAQSYALFPVRAFRYVAGEPRVYASSVDGRREFCNACGSQVAFRDSDGVALNTGCLDDPSRLPPRRHIWTASRVAWFQTADDLPREPGAGEE